MNFVSLNELLSDIRSSIVSLAQYNFDLVVGIPRSGMIPAYTIGLYLNIDVTDLNSFLDNKPLQRGNTRESKFEINYPQNAKNILLVDDSISSGKSLEDNLSKIPKQLKEKITTMAIYAIEDNHNMVDLHIRLVGHPRVFEWNIFNHSIINHSCFDIDGVLCEDPTEEQNDDGDLYLDFIANARPKFIPKYKIKYLVTNRLEKYRAQTVEWLGKHHVQYEYLIMLDMKTKEERQKSAIHSMHKAKFYKKSGCILFVESDPRQAYEIMNFTGLSVYCVDSNVMFKPDTLNQFIKQPRKCTSDLLFSILRLLPKPIKTIIKKMLRP